MVLKVFIFTTTEKGKKMKDNDDFTVIDRQNKNYKYLMTILNGIYSKTLKVSVINYLLFNRKEAFFIYLHSNNRVKTFIEQIELLDGNFSFDKMFFMDTYFNTEFNFYSNKEKDLEALVALAKGEISVNEAFFRIKKQNKLKSLEIFHLRILNLFEENTNNVLLELDLDKPLDELQEIVKLAKKFYDRNKKNLDKYQILKNKNILDKKLFDKFISKRTSTILLEEKLIDLLFMVDNKLIEAPKKLIKQSLQNYYISNLSNFPQLDISYVLKEYYKNLEKEANTIIQKIKN